MKGEDRRKDLLLNFAALVRVAPPDFVVVENVPGLNTAYGRDVYDRFTATLDEVGITHRSAALLDSADFGVPQVRNRFIMLGSRHGPIPLPSPDPAGRRTVRMGIEYYPVIRDGTRDEATLNHVSRHLYPHHRRILEAIPKDGGGRADVADVSILLKCHQERPNVHKDVFGRMSWDQPSPTLTGRCIDVYCGRFAHPEQDRGISLREAAALRQLGSLAERTADLRLDGLGRAIPFDNHPLQIVPAKEPRCTRVERLDPSKHERGPKHQHVHRAERNQERKRSDLPDRCLTVVTAAGRSRAKPGEVRSRQPGGVRAEAGRGERP